MAQPPEDDPEQSSEDPAAAPESFPGYGAAPDPASAYPGPSEGTATPLPDLTSGSYGPPGPGYRTAADASTAAPQATDALRRAWDVFTANPWPFVLSQLIWGLIVLIPALALLAAFRVLRFAEGGFPPADAGSLLGLGGVLTVLVVVLASVVQQGAFATATLKAVDGVRVGVADFFRPQHLPQLLLLAILLGVAAALLAITGVGPLIVLFFGVWAVLLVTDRGLPALEALRVSVQASLRAPGQTIVLVLAAYLLNAVGALLCGVGTLVTTPVAALSFADFFRRSGSFSPR